jgi:hypothetical protein
MGPILRTRVMRLNTYLAMQMTIKWRLRSVELTWTITLVIPDAKEQNTAMGLVSAAASCDTEPGPILQDHRS